MMHIKLLFILLLIAGLGCSTAVKKNPAIEVLESSSMATIGSIDILDPAALEIIDTSRALEILAEGHDWTEGPVWIAKHELLLYSDIPPNSIFAWSEEKGPHLFLTPSGYTGEMERNGEPGSNGLLLDSEGRLVLCQHGDRRITRHTGSLSDPQPTYETIADNWQGKRFNSPNDAAYHQNGDLYITDPPYGLEKNVDDPAKEIAFQGVYRIGQDGTVTLLIDSITRPNGIAFSPDFRTLYVACSDPTRAKWYQYELDMQGDIIRGSELYNVTPLVGQEKGLPDGLKVHPSGVLFATGPGGVWIISPEGKALALLRTTQATANCAFDDDFQTLYITADMYLLRLKLKT